MASSTPLHSHLNARPEFNSAVEDNNHEVSCHTQDKTIYTCHSNHKLYKNCVARYILSITYFVFSDNDRSSNNVRFPLQTHSIHLRMHNCKIIFCGCVSEHYTLGNGGERERQEDIFAVDQESPLAPPLPMRKKYNSVTYICAFVHVYVKYCPKSSSIIV